MTDFRVLVGLADLLVNLNSLLSIFTKLAPIGAKLRGSAPLCPWNALAQSTHPSTWRIRPPTQKIEVVEEREQTRLLRFDGKHPFWFPRSMEITADLWSEYLVAFWPHPVNFHHYFRRDVAITPGDLVFDCGACEGFFTRRALEAGASKVVCVEPSPAMAECLGETFATEIHAGQVIVARQALGTFAGSAGFATSDDDAFAGRFDSESAATVKVTTLDQLAKTHGTPDFIKMDLEGSEYQALSGGQELLRTSHPKLGITTYHNPWDYAVVSSFLKGLDYAHLKPYGVTFRGGSIPRPVMLHGS